MVCEFSEPQKRFFFMKERDFNESKYEEIFLKFKSEHAKMKRIFK